MMKKAIALLLAAAMLLTLAACGKKKDINPNLIELGDCTLLYKGACIMEDSDGNDAIVLTLDFTNNGKEAGSYLWSVNETVVQNGTELEVATVYADYDTFTTVIENQFEEAAPGATLEVQTAFVLNDATGEVKATFEELLGSKKGTITIDPSTLTRKTGADTDTDTEPTLPTEATGDALLDWWNGEWYGWWKMTDCSGSYESMENQWWDVCGVIELGADRTGTVTLWDEDYTKSDAMASAAVSLSDAGTGEHGTLTSEGGWFTDVALAHADWIVDPGLQELADIICIDGWYENGDDAYRYEIYLRPWGLYWDDVEEENRPYRYDDWYLPLIDAGESMPDRIGEGAENGAAPDGDYGLSNEDAAGTATLEQMREAYAEISELQRTYTYAMARETLGSDGIPWKDSDATWSDGKHSYKWENSDGDFLYISFEINDGDEYYVSCTFSRNVTEGNS